MTARKPTTTKAKAPAKPKAPGKSTADKIADLEAERAKLLQDQQDEARVDVATATSSVEDRLASLEAAVDALSRGNLVEAQRVRGTAL